YNVFVADFACSYGCECMCCGNCKTKESISACSGKPKYKYEHYDDELIERKENIKRYICAAEFSTIKQMIDICVL
ncbi:MAG: hypothetical protein IJ261_04770, partial [Clostridia bacterium]|nr:hypothetical protein [Clostridia bacterium]